MDAGASLFGKRWDWIDFINLTDTGTTTKLRWLINEHLGVRGISAMKEKSSGKGVGRRDFLSGLSVAAAASAAAYFAGPRPAGAMEVPKGDIPETPIKIGHMTFLSGPGAALGAPSLKGFKLAAEEINAEGGFLGKRKIESVVADEAGGTDAAIKELRRMKLAENIDWFTGVISAGDTVGLGPVAEELEVLTVFTDGCTDHLFDRVVKNPKYVFRVTNILSSDAVSCMVAASKTWPGKKRIAHIHPDYNFGRVQFIHSKIAGEKLYPGSKIVAEAWPKIFSGDYAAHITKIIGTKPDLLVTSLWGGDYIAFYKQALTFGLFDKMNVVSNIGFGIEPSSLGKDHPEGILAGAHANYHFTYPPGDKWPLNKQFVENYHKRWNEYPNYAAEGSYSTLYLFKNAIEKFNKLVGGWPQTDQIILMLEGMTMATPAGYLNIRSEDHSGFKPTVVGFSKNVPEYPFPIWDPDTIITTDVRSVTAPPDWPKPGDGHDDPSATYNWIKTTWKESTA